MEFKTDMTSLAAKILLNPDKADTLFNQKSSFVSRKKPFFGEGGGARYKLLLLKGLWMHNFPKIQRISRTLTRQIQKTTHLALKKYSQTLILQNQIKNSVSGFFAERTTGAVEQKNR